MAHALWWVGTVLAWAHIPGFIAIMVLGRLWMSVRVYTIMVGIIVSLQAATLGCPLMPLIMALKHPYEPTYDYGCSLTWLLYHQFGPLFAVPVFIGSLGLAWLISRVTWIPQLKARKQCSEPEAAKA